MGLINVINPYIFATGGGGGNPATVGAVLFDGTNDYLTKAADWTGSANNDTFIVSFWIQIQGGDGTSRTIFSDDLGRCQILITSDNKIRVDLRASAFVTSVTIETTTAITDDGNWHHFMASVDDVSFAAHLYLDGVSDMTTITAPTFTSADWTTTSKSLGATTSGTQKINADLSEFYLNIVTGMDLSVQSNREKFIFAGAPVDLGANATIPTGVTPILYLRHVTGQAATDFATNQGSGGDMTIVGTLTQSANSPSD